LVLFAICKEIKKCVNQSGQLFFVCWERMHTLNQPPNGRGT
jgi:hypothetical protein